MNMLLMIVSSIQDEIKLHYKYKISYDKACVAKQKAMRYLFNSHMESYEKLPRLLLVKKISYPETINNWAYKGIIDNSIVIFVRVF